MRLVELQRNVVDLFPHQSSHNGFSMPSSLSARLLCLTAVFAAVASGQMTVQEKAAQVASFELVWSTVRDHNPDPKLNGLDWDGIHESFKPRIEKARSASEVRGILREMIARLGVSHYSIIASNQYGSAAETPTQEVPAAVPTVVRNASAASLAVQPPPAVPSPKPAAVDITPPQAAPVDSKGTTVEFGNLPKTRVEFEARTLEGGVGYIRFNEFLDPVSLMPRFDAAMKSFAHAPGVILDLRGNRGGIGIMAMGIAGYFIGDSGHQLGEMKMRGSTLKFAVFPAGGGILWAAGGAAR